MRRLLILFMAIGCSFAAMASSADDIIAQQHPRLILHEGDMAAVRDMVAGKPGAVRDIVVLNAAAALLAYRGISTVTELVAQLEPAVKAASEAIDSGKASQTLEAWVAATQR